MLRNGDSIEDERLLLSFASDTRNWRKRLARLLRPRCGALFPLVRNGRTVQSILPYQASSGLKKLLVEEIRVEVLKVAVDA